MLIKKAIILAAGFGKRLLPLTKERPKPLLEIGGKKLIEYSIDLLRENNITEIIINSHYLPVSYTHLTLPTKRIV